LTSLPCKRADVHSRIQSANCSAARFTIPAQAPPGDGLSSLAGQAQGGPLPPQRQNLRDNMPDDHSAGGGDEVEWETGRDGKLAPFVLTRLRLLHQLFVLTLRGVFIPLPILQYLCNRRRHLIHE
jgi:hypothetical protein